MTRSRREAGFALVTALWAAVILALIAASVIGMSRTEARIGHNAVQIAVLEAADQGAIAMVQLRLMAPDAGRLPLDARPLTVACGGHDVIVTLQDQAGLVDLNAASAEDLGRLFQFAGGFDAATAEALADRVLDWREPGVGRRLNGAKAPDYQAAGLAYGPRERPFASVAELKLVLGMTTALFERVEPALTVTSQLPSADAAVAPRAVLLAIARGDQAAVERELAERAERHRSRSAETAGNAPTGRAIRITAEARGTSGMLARQTTVVRVTGFGNAPFWIYPGL